MPITYNIRRCGWSLLLTGLGLLVPGAWADVRITQVLEDGRPRNVLVNSTNADRHADSVQLPSTDRPVSFLFTESDGEGNPSQRLRYKLEGYDDNWHELINPVEMRMTVQFFDFAGNLLGIDSFAMNGETPGWRGSVEKSDFQLRREQTTAPGRSAKCKLVLLSQGPESIIGMAAVDAVRLHVEHVKESGKSDDYDLSVTQGTELDDPMGSPANWSRQGTRAGMSQLRTRPTPVPHPVLVLNDEDALRFSTWDSGSEKMFPVQAGDHLTLAWQTAHSIGCAGPGQADYPKLKPGRYWFRVATAKANGEFGGTEVSLPIEVMLPISRRPEFWIIVAAIAAGVGTWMGRTLQRQRMKRRLAEIERQQALEHERARIARDLHDDIGAGLTEIAMKSALVRRDLERIPTPETRRHIDRVCQSAIELTRSVDEIVWAVNPANDTLNHFVNYLTQSTEQFLDATGLRVRFDLPPSIPALELSGKTRHLVFLAVREALNNAVKHAAAKLIRLEIKVADGGLRIVVEDDGQGFAPKQELSAGTHEGLKNMQRRMAEIGGQFQLTSRPEGGTRVEFCLSLPERRNQR